jgi:phenylpropionate dioxygenase-like ring-hydroxylating dioxygenase large terminal subunit
MAEGDAKPASSAAALRFGEGFLRDIWYFAALGPDLKPGRLQRYEILGEPILLGRTRAGQTYALRDVCPHRAAPLSAGRLVRGDDGGELVECPYHGWRYRTDGACAAIPSLVDEQEMDVGRIRVRAYPVAESQGLVFVWMGSNVASEPDQAPPIFPAAAPNWSIGWSSTPISTTRSSG